jgi:hypothetical protein
MSRLYCVSCHIRRGRPACLPDYKGRIPAWSHASHTGLPLRSYAVTDRMSE